MALPCRRSIMLAMRQHEVTRMSQIILSVTIVLILPHWKVGMIDGAMVGDGDSSTITGMRRNQFLIADAVIEDVTIALIRILITDETVAGMTTARILLTDVIAEDVTITLTLPIWSDVGSMTVVLMKVRVTMTIMIHRPDTDHR